MLRAICRGILIKNGHFEHITSDIFLQGFPGPNSQESDSQYF
jgi:hypothetical protein